MMLNAQTTFPASTEADTARTQIQSLAVTQIEAAVGNDALVATWRSALTAALTYLTDTAKQVPDVATLTVMAGIAAGPGVGAASLSGRHAGAGTGATQRDAASALHATDRRISWRRHECVTLHVNGNVYQTWTRVRISQGLKRGCSDFQFETPGEYFPSIQPFMPCIIKDDGDTVLTGYVDCVEPDVSARESRTVISGRSKILDLVDCMPAFATNQFNGYALDAIARTMAAAFGIDLVIGPNVDVGAAFPDATFERAEKAFAFIARLARQRGLLLVDDSLGDLVLATLGTDRAPASLVMGPGGNVFRAKGTLDGKERYSQYTIRSQCGIHATGGTVQNAVAAVAYDGAVPRYRPWAGIAESSALTSAAQDRANWEAAHRSGQAVKATLSVPGWRAAGMLWQLNQIVACLVPRLGLDTDLLIGEVTFSDDAEAGRVTELTVQPPSAFLPDPAERKKGKGHKGGADPWQGLVPVA